MSVRQARAYFKREKPIKRLPRDLVTPFDVRDATHDESLLMKASAAKDRHAVKRLMTEYGTTDPMEVIRRLPVQKVTSFKVRLLNWLRRLEGSSEHDPLISELRQLNRKGKYIIRHGYLETPLED